MLILINQPLHNASPFVNAAFDMRVNINKTGGDNLIFRIENGFGFGRWNGTDAGHFAIFYGYISIIPGITRTIDNPPIFDNDVILLRL